MNAYNTEPNKIAMPRECNKIKYSTKKEAEGEAHKLLEKYKPKAGEEIHFDSYKCAICTVDTWHVTSIYVAMTKRSKENAEKTKARIKELERQLAKEQQKPKDGPKVSELTAQVKSLQKQLSVAHGILSQALNRAFPKDPPKRAKSTTQIKNERPAIKKQEKPAIRDTKAENQEASLTRTGFRAVSAAELMHIEESGYKIFPPSNGSVHFNFDQAKAEAVANRIASTTGSAFMVKFEVNVEVLKHLKNNPSDIDKINENIIGKIELTGKQYSKKVVEVITKAVEENK